MQTSVLNFYKHQPVWPVCIGLSVFLLLFAPFFFPTTLKAESLSGIKENTWIESLERLVEVDVGSAKKAGVLPAVLTGISETGKILSATAKEKASAPQILGLIPEKGDQYVEQHIKPEIHFDAGVVLGEGLIELYNGETGAQLKTLDPTAGTGISQPEARVVRLDSGVLELNTSYYILFAEGSFKDTEGNPAGGISNNIEWFF